MLQADRQASQWLGESVAVDMRETRQVLVMRLCPSLWRRVQHLENSCQPGTEVRRVSRHALLDVRQGEVVLFKGPNVIGERAQERPHREQL